MFFQPPPTAAVAPSSRVLLSRTSRALLSRLRADFCSSCWTFSVVSVSYRNKTEVSSRDPSRRRRSRATLEVPFSRGDWETLGGSPEATSPSPGTSPGTGARRRDVSGAAPLARPCPRRLGGLESPEWVSGGGRVSESLRGLSRTRGSCRRKTMWDGESGTADGDVPSASTPPRTTSVERMIRRVRRPRKKRASKVLPRARGIASSRTRH